MTHISDIESPRRRARACSLPARVRATLPLSRSKRPRSLPRFCAALYVPRPISIFSRISDGSHGAVSNISFRIRPRALFPCTAIQCMVSVSGAERCSSNRLNFFSRAAVSASMPASGGAGLSGMIRTWPVRGTRPLPATFSGAPARCADPACRPDPSAPGARRAPAPAGRPPRMPVSARARGTWILRSFGSMAPARHGPPVTPAMPGPGGPVATHAPLSRA